MRKVEKPGPGPICAVRELAAKHASRHTRDEERERKKLNTQAQVRIDQAYAQRPQTKKQTHLKTHAHELGPAKSSTEPPVHVVKAACAHHLPPYMAARM